MLTPMLALAVRSGDVWPGLRVEDGEVLLQVVARDGGSRVIQPDTARATVRVVGPRGPEPARLVAVPFRKDWNPQPMAVRVERSPESGWREVAVDATKAVSGGRFPGGPVARLRYYLPAVDTAEADRRLRARLLGTDVWVLGAAVIPDGLGPASDVDQIGWDPRLPATVVGVERLARPLAEISSAYCWDLFNSWSTVDFYAANPLAIRLRLPTHDRFRLAGAIGGDTGWTPDLSPKTISEATVYLADPWQISRLLLPSPEPVLRVETPAIRAGFAKRRIVLGMPRTLVARVLGDPEAGAPYGDVWHRRSWFYYGNAPFFYQVDFDASGRVRGAGLQGELP